MASFHGLLKICQNLNLAILNRQLERAHETRLPGMKFQENLKLNDHVKNIANYASLILWVKSSTHCQT